MPAQVDTDATPPGFSTRNISLVTCELELVSPGTGSPRLVKTWVNVLSFKPERLRASNVSVSMLLQCSVEIRCVTSSIIAGEISVAKILASGCCILICSLTIPGPQALSRMYDACVIGGDDEDTITVAIKRVQLPDLSVCC